MQVVSGLRGGPAVQLPCGISAKERSPVRLLYLIKVGRHSNLGREAINGISHAMTNIHVSISPHWAVMNIQP